ncbi:MAG: hypothetical protein OXN21_12205, partial [Chloroflexota bacterium]|nr:hypothetical protein [Chloroflexota bacterium]
MAITEPMDPADGTITLVIFGASGDLTRRKLIPALASLHSKGRLPPNLNILGVARSDMGDAEFHTVLEEFLGSDGMSKPTPGQWADFTSRLHYLHGDVTSAEDMEEVRRKLADIEGEGNVGNRLYYLSLAPSLYQPAIT